MSDVYQDQHVGDAFLNLGYFAASRDLGAVVRPVLLPGSQAGRIAGDCAGGYNLVL